MALSKIFAVLAIITLIFSICIRAIFRFKKNTYSYEFKKDELIKIRRENGGNNYYYNVSGIDANYYLKYVFRNNAFENSLVLEYAKHYNQITFFVAEYDSKYKLIEVLEVTEDNTFDLSKVIKLNDKAKYVNLHIYRINNHLIDKPFVQMIDIKNIWIAQFFKALIMLCSMYILSFAVTEFVAEFFSKYYFESFFGFLTILYIFIATLLYFISSSISLSISQKKKIGGVVKYEF